MSSGEYSSDDDQTQWQHTMMHGADEQDQEGYAGAFDMDEEELNEQHRAEVEEEQYQEALAEPSSCNDGRGIKVIPILQPIFPALKAGEKRCVNCAKPAVIQCEALYIHEASCLQDFLEPILVALQGKGNLLANKPLTYVVVANEIRSKTFKVKWKLAGWSGESPLSTVTGYKDMIEQAIGRNKPELKVTLDEILQPEIPSQTPQAQDETPDDVDRPASKRQKKTHVPSREEHEIQSWIEKLQAKHHCQDASCKAGGAATCLVRDEKHIPLTPQSLRFWATCICSHQEGVDDENPPNTPEFMNSNADVDDIARLAARRRKALEPSQVHNINVNLAGLTDLIHARDSREPSIPRQHSHTPSLPPAANSLSRLDLDEPEVKEKYKLTDKTIGKLRAADISGLHALAHITDEDLTRAQLSVGEVADVRWAEQAWRSTL
ncbi:hypothetical protein VKT23_013053 [Stygiomarasmius scandens]|uniref:SAM domain-containing protein n=1 Tax=Marasmiellus scandens TaxID=2682957 RepID=A0ABR1J4U9_9AGAR